MELDKGNIAFNLKVYGFKIDCNPYGNENCKFFAFAYQSVTYSEPCQTSKTY